MNYKEVQSFLFSQLPMYQRQGVSAFKKDLTNILALCELLGNPQNQFKSIHIAGTNGKGSVSHMIAAGLQANGYKIGLYTSPHYKDYRERIKINGEFISETEVISFVEKHKDAFLEIQPSFFEITVTMAFDHFAKSEVDFAIIETGLGGRLDSTNILTPILSIITNISLDHQSMLGDNLPQIAGEKAGIIKSNIPVIIGETQDEVKDIFCEKASSQKSKIFFADQEAQLSSRENNTARTFSFSVNDNIWISKLETTLTNPYQIKNLTTALFTLNYLSEKLKLDTEKIAFGIKNIHSLTYYIGRWMIIQDAPKIIFDSAHNEAGVSHLVEQIKNISFHQLHIIWGTAADKDISKILDLLPKNAIYYFAKANIPRGMKAEELRDKALKHNLHGHDYPSVASAYRIAKATANTNDLVIVAGSIFVIAEVLED